MGLKGGKRLMPSLNFIIHFHSMFLKLIYSDIYSLFTNFQVTIRHDIYSKVETPFTLQSTCEKHEILCNIHEHAEPILEPIMLL